MTNAVTSKKLRKKVLKRDKFKCTVCHWTPERTLLEIVWGNDLDQGGHENLDNAIAVCRDCLIKQDPYRYSNSGKPIELETDLGVMAMRKAQIEQYRTDFIEKLGLGTVEKAAGIALFKLSNDDPVKIVRYFCGICHNWINET